MGDVCLIIPLVVPLHPPTTTTLLFLRTTTGFTKNTKLSCELSTPKVPIFLNGFEKNLWVRLFPGKEKKRMCSALHLAYRILIFFFICLLISLCSYLLFSFHQRHGISDCFFSFFLPFVITSISLFPRVENYYLQFHNTLFIDYSPTARTPFTFLKTCLGEVSRKPALQLLRLSGTWQGASLLLFCCSCFHITKKTKAVGRWIERLEKKAFSQLSTKKSKPHTTFSPFVVTIIICHQN